MAEIEMLEVNAKQIKTLTNAILDVGQKYKPDPKVFLVALKLVETVIARDLENAEECDCVNCQSLRSGKKKVKNENNYKETLH